MLDASILEYAWLLVAVVAAGAFTGLLAGIFGVGGGAVAVPILYELFRLLEVPEQVRMPLCVGTSLAIIIPTSIRSFNAHRAKGAVDLSILRIWAVPVVLGVILGPMLELEFRNALQISQGDLTVFVTRPISAILLATAVAALVLPQLPRLLGHGKRIVFGSGSED